MRYGLGMETTTYTCGWLVQRANGNPEPDFPEDCYDIVECGGTVPVGSDGEPTGRHALCEFHQGAMDLPEDEFDRISEMHDGHAFS